MKKLQEREGEDKENMPIKREEDFWKEEIRQVRTKFLAVIIKKLQNFLCSTLPDSSNIEIRDFNICVETGHLLLDSRHRISSDSSVLVVCANDTDTEQCLF